VDDEDFQAGIMIEMGMAGRDHQFVVSVLNFWFCQAGLPGPKVVFLGRKKIPYRLLAEPVEKLSCCPLFKIDLILL
jgi:hypothetical protein